MNIYYIVSIVKDTMRCQEGIIHGSYSLNTIIRGHNQAFFDSKSCI